MESTNMQLYNDNDTMSKLANACHNTIHSTGQEKSPSIRLSHHVDDAWRVNGFGVKCVLCEWPNESAIAFYWVFRLEEHVLDSQWSQLHKVYTVNDTHRFSSCIVTHRT